MRRLNGRQAKPFRYLDLGSMATIARFRAVASVGRIQIVGFGGWLMWLVVHLVFLTGFRNRPSAVANRTVAFLGRGRRRARSPSSRCSPAPTRQPNRREKGNGKR